MRMVFQSRAKPSEILLALCSLANDQVTKVRMAVAYTTNAGCNRLFPSLEKKMGQNTWFTIPKTIVTSLEFGHTDPSALSYLSSIPNLDVQISNPAVIERPGMRPTFCFHPKLYLFDRDDQQSILVGSANISQNALTINTEAAYLDENVSDKSIIEMTWSAIVAQSEALTTDLLDQYTELRTRTPYARGESPLPTEELPPPVDLPSNSAIPAFGTAVSAGSLLPSAYDRFWIEAGSMSSGGSRNQLELPRGANRYFGYNFTEYSAEHFRIGYPPIIVSGHQWTDRSLTWHGYNAMERINLPTETQAGLTYQNTAILFQRSPGGFELMVVPWDDHLAVMWREASAEANLLFRIGEGTNRLCGFW